MGGNAGEVDTDERWADRPKTDYPLGWRLLQRGLVVWAFGGLLGIIFIEGFLLPKAPVSVLSDIRVLMGLGWFAIAACWAFILGSWQREIVREEHLRLLSLPDTGRPVHSTLLDPNRSRYIMKRSSLWAGNIYDEHGRTIGWGAGSRGDEGQVRSVHEVDGTPILLIQPGVPDENRRPRDTYDITDGERRLLGTVKWWTKGGWSSSPIAMDLVAPSVHEGAGNREEQVVLVARGWRRNFAIREEKSGRRVAEFKEYDVSPEVSGESDGKFWKRILGHPMYSFHVLDSSYDKRTLIGFAKVYFDKLEAHHSVD